MTPEIFHALSHNDLRLYYQHTYLRMRTANNQPYRWVMFEDFHAQNGNSTRNIIALVRTAAKTGQLTQVPVEQIDPDFAPPAPGAYTFRNTVILVQRNPVRGTAKGVSRHNTTISNLLGAVARAGAIPRPFYEAHDFHMSPESLNELLEDAEQIPFEKGFAKLQRKQMLAFAVNSRIALSQGILSKLPTVWLKTRPIGELDLIKETIYPLHTAFVPELTNAFIDKGITVKT